MKPLKTDHFCRKEKYRFLDTLYIWYICSKNKTHKHIFEEVLLLFNWKINDTKSCKWKKSSQIFCLFLRLLPQLKATPSDISFPEKCTTNYCGNKFRLVTWRNWSRELDDAHPARQRFTGSIKQDQMNLDLWPREETIFCHKRPYKAIKRPCKTTQGHTCWLP